MKLKSLGIFGLCSIFSFAAILGYADAVLCWSSDGHFALEDRFHDDCGGAEEVQHNGCEDHCGGCDDLSIDLSDSVFNNKFNINFTAHKTVFPLADFKIAFSKQIFDFLSVPRPPPQGGTYNTIYQLSTTIILT